MKRAATHSAVLPDIQISVPAAPDDAAPGEREGVLRALDVDRTVLCVRPVRVKGELKAVDITRRLRDGSEVKELRIYREDEVRRVGPVVEAMRARALAGVDAERSVIHLGAALWLERFRTAIEDVALAPHVPSAIVCLTLLNMLSP